MMILPSAAPSAGALRGNATCVAAVVFFAAGFPAAEVLLASWGPISLITARIILACAFLMPLWLVIDGWRRVAETPWRRAFGIGALGFGIGTILLLVVQDLSNPVTAALVAATMPVSAVALEILHDERRMTRNFVLGAALVLVGGFIATGADIRDGSLGGAALLGFLASMLFAWGSRMAVKGLPEMSNFGRTTATLIGAMSFCVAACAAFWALDLPGLAAAPLGAWEWAMLLVYAWGAMAVSQAFWLLGVARLGVGVASFHLNAAPFYVMLIMIAAGDAWNNATALGAAILAAGVILAQRRASDRAASDGVSPEAAH